MNYFVLNIFLALVWMLINGSYSLAHFMVGFIIGFAILWLSQPLGFKTTYPKRLRALVRLIGYFFYALFASAWRVVWDVMTPTHLSDPDLVKIPLEAKTNWEIALLANIISLTPGTLSLNITENRKYLILHVMFAPNHDEIIHDIKDGIEKKLLEVMRG